MLDVVRAELRCRRPIELCESPHVVTAATVGWRRPVIMLPPKWSEWSSVQRHAVLAHEVAHICRNDFATWVSAQLGVVLHFYHPLVHWLAGRLRLEQELAADAMAAGVVGGNQSYLKALADLALRQPDQPVSWPARTFLPTRRTFLRRIEMLRDPHKLGESMPSRGRVAMVSVLILVAAAAAGLRGPAPWEAAAAPPDVQRPGGVALTSAVETQPDGTYTKEQIVSLLGSIEERVKTFDVWLSVRKRFHFNSKVDEDVNHGVPVEPPPEIQFTPIPGQELVWSSPDYYRQLRSQSGHRRAEKYAQPIGEPIWISVFDGKHDIHLSPENSSGTLSLPRASLLNDSDVDYGCYCDRLMWTVRPASIAVERRRLRVQSAVDGTARVLVDIPPNGDAPSLKGLGFRVYLDPAKDSAMCQVDQYADHGKHGKVLIFRRVIEHAKTSDGLIVPVRATTSQYITTEKQKEQLYLETVGEVDLERSKWNEPLADDHFEIAIPPGTTILDTIRDVTVVNDKDRSITQSEVPALPVIVRN